MAKNKDLERLVHHLESGDDAAVEAHLTALFEGEEYSFGEGFEERVAGRLTSSQERNVFDFMPTMFKWVAIASAAAAVVLLMMTWQAESSLSMDAFAGISEISLEDMTALNDF